MQNGKAMTIIAAMARNRAIGFEGGMPWHLPGELRHFKETTWGKPIVMGRKTWESIGRVLPGRQNIVVTRNGGYLAKGCLVVQSLPLALEKAKGRRSDDHRWRPIVPAGITGRRPDDVDAGRLQPACRYLVS